MQSNIQAAQRVAQRNTLTEPKAEAELAGAMDSYKKDLAEMKALTAQIPQQFKQAQIETEEQSEIPYLKEVREDVQRKLDLANDEIRQHKFDPERAFKSTTSKVLSILAIALTGQKAFDGVMGMIDRDMDAQKAELDRKRATSQAYQNEYSIIQSHFKDAQMADDVFRARKLEGFNKAIEALQGRIGNSAKLTELEERIANRFITINDTVSDNAHKERVFQEQRRSNKAAEDNANAKAAGPYNQVGVFGNIPVLTPETKNITSGTTAFSNASAVAESLNGMNEILKRNKGVIFIPANDKAEYNTYMNQMISMLSRIGDGSVVREPEFQRTIKQIADLSNITAAGNKLPFSEYYVSSPQAGLAAIAKQVAPKMEGEIKSLVLQDPTGRLFTRKELFPISVLDEASNTDEAFLNDNKNPK